MDAYWENKVDLTAALRMAARLDLHEGVDNHFSVMLSEKPFRFLLNPNRRHWSAVRASELVEVDETGSPIGDFEAPETTAFVIHSRIHMACPHAKCIFHTHMRYATALTMLEGGRLEPVVQSALKFFGQVAYLDDFGGLALDEEEGDKMAKALGDKRILFLANHGVIIVGPTVAHAFNDLYYLENACIAQITAMSSGVPLKRIPQDVAAHTHEQMQKDRDDQSSRHFNEIKRILEKDEPDYAS